MSMIDLWSRKQGGWFQDDAVALISPQSYRKHVVAAERRLSGCMDVTGIHLHPPSLFAVKDLVQMPKLGVIEVNYEKPYGMALAKMMPFLQEAIASKCLIVWGDFDENDLKMLADNLPTRGLALDLIGSTPEKLRAVVSTVEQVWGKRRA